MADSIIFSSLQVHPASGLMTVNLRFLLIHMLRITGIMILMILIFFSSRSDFVGERS
jgi:hypothetical protein